MYIATAVSTTTTGIEPVEYLLTPSTTTTPAQREQARLRYKVFYKRHTLEERRRCAYNNMRLREQRRGRPFYILRNDYFRILGMNKGRCVYCGRRRATTLDHVDPNGAGSLGNLLPACRYCNASKGVHDVRVWLSNTKQTNRTARRIIALVTDTEWLPEEDKDEQISHFTGDK